jgi:hypothetical protein
MLKYAMGKTANYVLIIGNTHSLLILLLQNYSALFIGARWSDAGYVRGGMCDPHIVRLRVSRDGRGRSSGDRYRGGTAIAVGESFKSNPRAFVLGNRTMRSFSSSHSA